MRNLNLLLLSLFVILSIIPQAEAQRPVEKNKALNTLLKTNRVIGVANMAVKRGKVYTGNLGKAVRHERYAKALYLKGNYHKAIVHSRRARLFAMEAIKANKVKPTSDCVVTPEENDLAGTAPSDEELEKELDTENVAKLKDEDVVNQNNMDIDVK